MHRACLHVCVRVRVRVCAMFGEFFCSKRYVCIAWPGLVAVVAYSAFVAHVKMQINTFYSNFYDLLQTAGAILVERTSGDFEDGSGGSLEGFDAALAAKREEVWHQLWQFGVIVAPLVFASPTARWMRSMWSFFWRMALMRSYLSAWDLTRPPLEGASQRLHEDTQRFAAGLQGCLVTLLDSAFTLVLFTPILMNLSAEVAPPVGLGLELVRSVWLVLIANGAAIFGIVGAAVVGQKLVHLEVVNQKVEAALRRSLVLIEVADPTAETNGEGLPNGPQAIELRSIGETFTALRKNYLNLFNNFAFLNTFLAVFEQAITILPYVLCAPKRGIHGPDSR